MTRLLTLLRYLADDEDTRRQLVGIAAFFAGLFLLAFVTGAK